MRKEFLSCQGLSWPADRTRGARRAERQFLTSANGASCSARHELRSRTFLFIVSADRVRATQNTSLFSEPPPEGGLDLETYRQGAIYSASTESPGPDWKPGSGIIYTNFARILANAPPPHESAQTCFVCATQAHSHFRPQHWLLCHLGLY